MQSTPSRSPADIADLLPKPAPSAPVGAAADEPATWEDIRKMQLLALEIQAAPTPLLTVGKKTLGLKPGPTTHLTAEEEQRIHSFQARLAELTKGTPLSELKQSELNELKELGEKIENPRDKLRKHELSLMGPEERAKEEAKDAKKKAEKVFPSDTKGNEFQVKGPSDAAYLKKGFAKLKKYEGFGILAVILMLAYLAYKKAATNPIKKEMEKTRNELAKGKDCPENSPLRSFAEQGITMKVERDGRSGLNVAKFYEPDGRGGTKELSAKYPRALEIQGIMRSNWAAQGIDVGPAGAALTTVANPVAGAKTTVEGAAVSPDKSALVIGTGPTPGVTAVPARTGLNPAERERGAPVHDTALRVTPVGPGE